MFLVHRVLFEHVFLDVVRDAHRVDLFRDAIVDVRDKVGISLLLKVKVVDIDAVGCQIGVELRLLGELALTDLLAPERVLTEVLPVDALNWVLFEAAGKKVVEDRGETFNFRSFLFTNLLDQIFQPSGIKGWFSCGKLIQDAPECPDVRVKAVHTVILEQFWCHIVRGPTFRFLPLWIRLN